MAGAVLHFPPCSTSLPLPSQIDVCEPLGVADVYLCSTEQWNQGEAYTSSLNPWSYSVAEMAAVYFEIVVSSALFAPLLLSSTLVMSAVSCSWLQHHLFPHGYTKYHTCAQ